jgi:hypothetical protein
LNDSIELIAMGEEEGDKSIIEDAEKTIRELKVEIDRRQIDMLLSGEADANDTYVEVHAGAGGTESQDWASMLLRMYTRWAEGRGDGSARRRRSGYQIRDHSRQGAQFIRHDENRIRRSSSGPHLAL